MTVAAGVWTPASGSSFPTYTQGTAPAAPASGEFWWDTSVHVLKRYDGAAWQWVGIDALANVDTGGKVDTDILEWDTTTSKWIDATKPSGGGSSGAAWTQTVNESGASIANWTSIAGTWSADAGGFIKQTDTAAAYRGLKLTSGVPVKSKVVAECEMRFPAGTAAGTRAFIAPTSNGVISATSAPWLGIQNHATLGLFTQRGDQETRSSSFVVATNTWYVVRVWIDGAWITTSVNGTERTFRIGWQGMADADVFMLVTYGGPVHFRNIKAWRLDGPA